jgi:hypothetical protein
MHALHVSFSSLGVIWIIAAVVGKIDYLKGKESAQSSVLAGVAIGCLQTALYALDCCKPRAPSHRAYGAPSRV